jgi:hypothetical protein
LWTGGPIETRKVVSVYISGKNIYRDSLKLTRQNDPGFEPIAPVDFEATDDAPTGCALAERSCDR